MTVKNTKRLEFIHIISIKQKVLYLKKSDFRSGFGKKTPVTIIWDGTLTK
jgi:hypothetical protein